MYILKPKEINETRFLQRSFYNTSRYVWMYRSGLIMGVTMLLLDTQ
jgi:hypothetical protein